MKSATPGYQIVKSHIINGIRARRWAVGQQIPSEIELAKKFSISRMTANRAIRELTADGLLERIQGKGTFVSDTPALSSVLRIGCIADEIRERGNQYSCRVVSLRRTVMTVAQRSELPLPVGAEVAMSTIIHFENSVPLQVEERLVNLAVAPDYLNQDFTQMTPHRFLTRWAPCTRGEHRILACLPEARMQRWLAMESDQPCLRIFRTTWTGATVASSAVLTHPGNRYQLQTAVLENSF